MILLNRVMRASQTNKIPFLGKSKFCYKHELHFFNIIGAPFQHRNYLPFEGHYIIDSSNVTFVDSDRKDGKRKI